MEALVEERGDVRLRKIDIASWDSPVARQHGIQRIPKVALYDGTKLVSESPREVFELLGQR